MGTRRVSKLELARLRASRRDRWLRDAKKKFTDRFDYSKAAPAYQTQKRPKVEIRCLTHGTTSLTTPFDHLRSQSGGCKPCEDAIIGNVALKRESAKFHRWYRNRPNRHIELVS